MKWSSYISERIRITELDDQLLPLGVGVGVCALVRAKAAQKVLTDQIILILRAVCMDVTDQSRRSPVLAALLARWDRRENAMRCDAMGLYGMGSGSGPVLCCGVV